MPNERPVQIVSTTETNTFQFHENTLSKILLENHVKDLPVAVISVAGLGRFFRDANGKCRSCCLIANLARISFECVLLLLAFVMQARSAAARAFC